jgi:hypothetical protein
MSTFGRAKLPFASSAGVCVCGSGPKCNKRFNKLCVGFWRHMGRHAVALLYHLVDNVSSEATPLKPLRVNEITQIGRRCELSRAETVPEFPAERRPMRSDLDVLPVKSPSVSADDVIRPARYNPITSRRLKGWALNVGGITGITAAYRVG